MNWKSVGIVDVVIVAFLIYGVFAIERIIRNERNHSEQIILYEKQKHDLNKKVEVLKDKINEYEILIIQNNADIQRMSRSERDRTREVLNPR